MRAEPVPSRATSVTTPSRPASAGNLQTLTWRDAAHTATPLTPPFRDRERTASPGEAPGPAQTAETREVTTVSRGESQEDTPVSPVVNLQVTTVCRGEGQQP